jgi:subtilisin family serine protease
MKTFLLTLLIAASAAAQTPVAHIHAEGIDVDLAAPSSEAAVIVEFQQPPLALRAAPLQSFRDTFARFRSDLGVLQSRRAEAKSAIEPVIDYEYYQVFDGAACHVPRALLDDLRLLPYVKRVHADRTVQAFDDAANTKIGADRVWSTLGTRGKGVVVAIIDTGIDYTHPAFGGRVIGGYNFVKKTDDPFDDNGHGTHVAGIVGASSDVVSGVAPEVSIRAYKVLDAKGAGKDSDVIAGLDRAVADHCDVANLSLGSGAGNPDDAPSTAVDNAVAAGMVVCVAAGNAGDYDRIASPGMARNAITVGASDVNDVLASFSSRGPCPKLASIKPDVVAPGVSILSTLPNNSYGRLSGTSMATPHVTGAVALLRALHSDWTPAQIKSALMGTSAVLSYEVMNVGAGRIDVFRAASPMAYATPPQLNFGLDASNLTTFTQAANVVVTNSSGAQQSFDVSITDTARTGVTITASPATFDLPPNASRSVTVTLTVTNASAGTPPSASQTFGGLVVISNGHAPLMQVPWAFVKAARATVTYDVPESSLSWFSNGRGFLPVPLDETTYEFFTQPGNFDLLILSETQASPDAPADLQAVFVESQHLDGDMTLAESSTAATHHLDFEAADDTGKRLLSYDQHSTQYWYLNRSRIFSTDGGFRSLDLSASGFGSMSFSEVSDHYTVEPSETFVDFATRRIFQAQHRILTGVHQDETFPANLGDYVHVRPTLTFPSDGPWRLFMYTPNVDRLNPAVSAQATSVTISGRQWTPDIWLTPFPDPDRSDSVAFQLFSGGATFPEYVVPPLRAIGGKVVSAFPFVPSTTAFAAPPDAAYAFGDGPLYAKVFLRPSSAAVQVFGGMDEQRVRDATNALFSLTDANGNVVTSGFAARTSISLPTLPAGAYRFTYDMQPLSIGDRLAHGTLTSAFDTSRTDSIPPTITSLSLHDGSDRPVAHIAAGAPASLVFSAADVSAFSNTYAAVDNTATKLSIHIEGQPDWQALNLIQLGEDADVANGRPAPGLIYRAALPSIPDGSLVDVKIEIADPAGNATAWTLAPAFTVGNAPPFPGKRRRAG